MWGILLREVVNMDFIVEVIEGGLFIGGDEQFPGPFPQTIKNACSYS